MSALVAGPKLGLSAGRPAACWLACWLVCSLALCINRSVGRSVGWPVGSSAGARGGAGCCGKYRLRARSVRQSVGRLAARSLCQSAGKSLVGLSAGQPLKRLVNRPVGRSVDTCVLSVHGTLRFQTFLLALKRTVLEKKLETIFVAHRYASLFCVNCSRWRHLLVIRGVQVSPTVTEFGMERLRPCTGQSLQTPSPGVTTSHTCRTRSPCMFSGGRACLKECFCVDINVGLSRSCANTCCEVSSLLSYVDLTYPRRR